MNAETILVSQPFDESLTVASEEGRVSHKEKKYQATHASIYMLSEKAYQKVASRLRDWRKDIVATERKRFRRLVKDL